MLRKLISIVTVLTLTLFIAAPSALAVSDATASEVSISQYKDGYIYTESTNNWFMCITAAPNQPVDVAIKYENNPNYVYHSRLDCSVLSAQLPSTSFWNEVKSRFFLIDQPESMYVESEQQSKAVVATPRASALTTIYSRLDSYYGSEYDNVTRYTTSSYSPYTVKVTESMSFEVYLVHNYSVSITMSVADFLAAHYLNSLIGDLICAALDLYSIYSDITAGVSIDRYKAVVLFIRRGLCNNTPVVSATRSDMLEAVEAGGVTKVAALSSRETIYSPHEYDYEYSALAKAAYEGYIAIYG